MFEIERPQVSSIVIGFDSAWTDAPKAPGAISAIAYDANGRCSFLPPQLVPFAQALDFVQEARERHRFCLVALDQPTIVPNTSGSRPVEKVAASVVSYIGGGVQPSNRSKIGMFDDTAPVWAFKRALAATEDPELARTAQTGLFLIEVFPALALAGLHGPFAQRFGAPKYNPQNRRKYRPEDWQNVTTVVAQLADQLAASDLAAWARQARVLPHPRKADQDRLDSALCSIVGLIWRACSRNSAAMIGDLGTGYMITPVSPETRQRLSASAAANGVPLR